MYMCTRQCVEALVLELIFNKSSILFFRGMVSQSNPEFSEVAGLASQPALGMLFHILRLELLVGYHGIYVSSGELNSISHTLTTIVMEF